MPEYIERDAVLNQFEDTSSGIPEKWALRRIEEIPTADVVPVRHGRWIKDGETGEPICSVCYSGKPTRAVCSSVIEHKLKNYEIRYCYYCGARMDGDRDV